MMSVKPTRTNKLVDRYYQPLFQFAAQLCGSPGQAMLLTQRTFKRAFRQNRGQPLPANTRTWLCTLLFQDFVEGGLSNRRA